MVLFRQRFHLKPGGAHRDTDVAGFAAARDYAAVIVTQANDGFSAQIRAKDLLAAGIEAVDVSQGKHTGTPYRRARVR